MKRQEKRIKTRVGQWWEYEWSMKKLVLRWGQSILTSNPNKQVIQYKWICYRTCRWHPMKIVDLIRESLTMSARADRHQLHHSLLWRRLGQPFHRWNTVLCCLKLLMLWWAASTSTLRDMAEVCFLSKWGMEASWHIQFPHKTWHSLWWMNSAFHCR
jgi:hypothetical protein